MNNYDSELELKPVLSSIAYRGTAIFNLGRHRLRTLVITVRGTFIAPCSRMNVNLLLLVLNNYEN
jgi:hypothetical protein